MVMKNLWNKEVRVGNVERLQQFGMAKEVKPSGSPGELESSTAKLLMDLSIATHCSDMQEVG